MLLGLAVKRTSSMLETADFIAAPVVKTILQLGIAFLAIGSAGSMPAS